VPDLYKNDPGDNLGLAVKKLATIGNPNDLLVFPMLIVNGKTPAGTGPVLLSTLFDIGCSMVEPARPPLASTARLFLTVVDRNPPPKIDVPEGTGNIWLVDSADGKYCLPCFPGYKLINNQPLYLGYNLIELQAAELAGK
jgi:hypothetical protein